MVDVMVVPTMDLDELRRLCMQYDKKYGTYPESTFEGMSVYSFIYEKVTGQKPTETVSKWGNRAGREFASGIVDRSDT